jgi:hypothetical protein
LRALDDTARGLEVVDLDLDGRVEIWSEWRVGSGGFLPVYAHRWDGTERRGVRRALPTLSAPWHVIR